LGREAFFSAAIHVPRGYKERVVGPARDAFYSKDAKEEKGFADNDSVKDGALGSRERSPDRAGPSLRQGPARRSRVPIHGPRAGTLRERFAEHAEDVRKPPSSANRSCEHRGWKYAGACGCHCHIRAPRAMVLSSPPESPSALLFSSRHPFRTAEKGRSDNRRGCPWRDTPRGKALRQRPR